MAGEIVKKCNAFIKTMEASAKKLFQDYETADNVTVIHKDDKAKDPKKKYVPAKVTFKISADKIDKLRTGADQAQLVFNGASKTCTSAHMSDKARHVVPYINGKRVGEPYTSFAPVMKDYESKWASAMGNDLVNHDRKKAYDRADQYHLELKDGRGGIPQKEIDACHVKYVELTKDQFPKKNTSMEDNFAKILAELRKKKGYMSDEEWKRREELKNFRVSASCSGTINVFKNAGASEKKMKVPANILPPKGKDFGKRTTLPVSVAKFHKSKTYSDVAIAVKAEFNLVQYEFIPQMFIEKVNLTFTTKVAGLLGRMAGITMTCDFYMILEKGKDEPALKLKVPFTVDGLLNDDASDRIEITVRGTKIS